MKKYTIEMILSFIFKYIWILCAFILIVEGITTVNTANFLMMRTTKDIVMTTKNEIENKIDVTWKLAEALSNDYTISNQSIDMIERGRCLKPYAEVYDLFLIGLTDREGVIVSSYDNIPGFIGDRDYFKRVIATGNPEITDVFLAGADGATKNYTICYPFFDEQGMVSGTIIMSIYYEDINQITTRTLSQDTSQFSIMNSNNVIMSDVEESLIGESFLEVEEDSIIIGDTKEAINKAILAKKTGAYWEIYQGTLLYIRYTPIENTNWSLNIRTNVFKSAEPIFAQFIFKVILYLCIFTFISFFGKRYTVNKLKDVHSLIKQVTALQCELQSRKILGSDEIGEFIKMSQIGLSDGLTKLPTRSVFFKQQELAFGLIDINQNVALIIVDLDKLKAINDDFGHYVGDLALKHMGDCIHNLYNITESLACRYGGDEFLAYVPFGTIDEIHRILEDLRNQAHTFIEMEDVSVEIHASIGVAIYPKHGKSFDELYSHADIALYKAKQNGRNRYEIYNSDFDNKNQK